MCRCACGRLTKVTAVQIKNGRVKSCGCLTKERAHETNFINMEGRVFGRLTVLSQAPNNERGEVMWNCRCSCDGKVVQVRGCQLRAHDSLSCGCMSSTGEVKVREILESNNISYKREKTFKDLKSEKNYPLRFDFYITEGNYLIEYDGSQHFEGTQKGGWNTGEYFKKIKKNDEVKNEYCRRNNIPLIRIPYTQYDSLCLEDLMLEITKFRVN